VYPELVSSRDKIHSVIAEEEASFSRTLVKGIERFKKLAAAAQVRLLESTVRLGTAQYSAVSCCIFASWHGSWE
jgi:alanyl-tRNA synthetase